jgi:succinate dehydrogenase / fumarate reductase cytochrome b subunit
MSQHTKLLDALTSQVGRKLLTGITGVLLVVFVIGHLAGNLQLLLPDPEPFNRYTLGLHNLGALLIIVEVALALLILLHAYIGISIALRKKKARRNGYAVYNSKGGPSRQSLSSRTMIITGTVLLIFLVIHIVQFRFGPDISSGFVTQIDGKEARDLHRLVVETFANPDTGIIWVIFYVAVMVLLGFHLRHGVWSALQSLGTMKPRFSTTIYSIALILGILLAIGFLILPIWVHFSYRGAV